MACQTPYRGDTSQMLLFKIASCLADGGGGIGGGITLAEGDARYVLKSGDTMTGALSIGNGVQVASTPFLNLTQTWDNAAVTFTGLYSNITNTASDPDSNLFNFQVDGVDRFRFAVGGQLYAVRQDASDSGMTFFLRKRGNVGGATNAIADDSTIGTVAYSGWDGTAYATGARISAEASEAWTNTAHGSRIRFYTTPQGTTTEQLILHLSSNGGAQFLPASATLPSITFQGDTNTGIFNVGADSLGVSTGGTLRLTIASAAVTSSVPILLPDGTAALPSLSFQSDTNTGIYRIGVDILGFSTAGVERVRIDAAGNVGIGGSPAGKLDIIGSLGTVSFPPTGNELTFSRAGANYIYATNASGSMNIGVIGALDALFIHQSAMSQFLTLRSGGVGIGATNPTQALTIGVGLSLAFNSGANQRAGNAVLVAGTVTVANTSVTANTIVLLTRKTAGGTLGTAITYTVSAGTSFTINSDSIVDTSTFSYLLIEVP